MARCTERAAVCNGVTLWLVAVWCVWPTKLSTLPSNSHVVPNLDNKWTPVAVRARAARPLPTSAAHLPTVDAAPAAPEPLTVAPTYMPTAAPTTLIGLQFRPTEGAEAPETRTARRCLRRTNYTAPKLRRSADGDELALDYGPWSMANPRFVRKEHEVWWYKSAWFRWRNESTPQKERGRFAFAEAAYTAGRVHIMRDVVVRDAGMECGPSANALHLLQQVGPHDAGVRRRSDRVFWGVIPAVWAYQHWMENTLPKLAQASLLVVNWTGVEVNQELLLQRVPIIATLYEHLRMGFFDERGGAIAARELIFSCQTPPLHPYLWQLAQERFLRVPLPVALQDRPRRLALCSRRNTTTATNGGRRILNEADMVAEVQSATGWMFEDFVPESFSLVQLVEFLSTRVWRRYASVHMLRCLCVFVCKCPMI